MKALQVINKLSGGGAEKLVTEISIELNRKKSKQIFWFLIIMITNIQIYLIKMIFEL